jgi:hypothetical protein
MWSATTSTTPRSGRRWTSTVLSVCATRGTQCRPPELWIEVLARGAGCRCGGTRTGKQERKQLTLKGFPASAREPTRAATRLTNPLAREPFSDAFRTL